MRRRAAGISADDAFDIRTRAEKARYALLEMLGALAQYAANDSSPSIADRFTMLREITDPQNWTDPRAAADRIAAVIAERRGHRSFMTYLGQAAAAIEKYASVSTPIVAIAPDEALLVG